MMSKDYCDRITTARPGDIYRRVDIINLKCECICNNSLVIFGAMLIAYL